jgi:hypothetical protein
LQKHLHAFVDTVPPPRKEALPPKKNKKQNKNNPHLHLADELQRITGVDLTRIDGIDVMVEDDRQRQTQRSKLTCNACGNGRILFTGPIFFRVELASFFSP